MNSLFPHVKTYWLSYLATLPASDPIHSSAVSANFAGNAEITDELLALYLAGKKHAGSSVVEDFKTAGDPLPKVGNHWILLDSKENPGCILRTKEVVFHKFMEVPESIAIAEGEGDCSLAYWRQVHEELYTPYLKEWGLIRIEDATIVTEFFELVFK